MAFVSLYRRFRPDSFEKVIGQNHIVKTLINQIKNGRVGHSYLFTGTRGTGKTSCAKIFARAVNCADPQNGSPCNKCEVCLELNRPGNIDIIEIDAASNNGVDEIRQIKENTQYRPTTGKYKVYIIDEAHMLTPSAFNALLKTLEEPPEHIIFILATTEVQKLPATILSRCLRFDFRLIPTADIKRLLAGIFDELGVKYEDAAIERIALLGEGSVRDAVSIADMCMSYCDGDVTVRGVLEAVGAGDFDTIHSLGKAVLDGNSGEALTLLDAVYNQGGGTIHKDLCAYFRDLLAVKNTGGKAGSVTEDEAAVLIKTAESYENYRISRAMETLTGIEGALRYSTQPRILLEATVVKACEMRLDTSVESVLTRMKELEHKLEQLERRGVKPADSSPEAPPRQTAASVTQILEQTATAIEDETVFEEYAEEDSRAVEAWAGVIQKLKEKGEPTLYAAAVMVEELPVIESGALILRLKNSAVATMFNKPAFHRILLDSVKLVLGEDYEFICQKQAERTKQTEDGLEKLNMLFDKTLVLK